MKVLRGPALVGRRDLDGRLQHAEGWLLPRRHVQEGLQVKQRRPLHRRGALRAGARARRRPRAKHGRDGGAAARVNPTLLRSRRLASERAPALPRRRRRASNRARLSPRCCEDTRRFLLWGAARRTAVVWRNAKREEEGRGIGDEGIMSIFPKRQDTPELRLIESEMQMRPGSFKLCAQQYPAHRSRAFVWLGFRRIQSGISPAGRPVGHSAKRSCCLKLA